MKNKINLSYELLNFSLKSYVLGLDRSPGSDKKFVSHIYRGSFNYIDEPLCPKGWNRDGGKSFSILRNNVGKGICKVCMKNLEKEYAQPREING